MLNPNATDKPAGNPAIARVIQNTSRDSVVEDAVASANLAQVVGIEREMVIPVRRTEHAMADRASGNVDKEVAGYFTIGGRMTQVQARSTEVAKHVSVEPKGAWRHSRRPLPEGLEIVTLFEVFCPSGIGVRQYTEVVVLAFDLLAPLARGVRKQWVVWIRLLHTKFYDVAGEV